VALGPGWLQVTSALYCCTPQAYSLLGLRPLEESQCGSDSSVLGSYQEGLSCHPRPKASPDSMQGGGGGQRAAGMEGNETQISLSFLRCSCGGGTCGNLESKLWAVYPLERLPVVIYFFCGSRRGKMIMGASRGLSKRRRGVLC
jgi:hypothetical protein